MRHLNAHRKLGRTSEHRMSMLRNLATSLNNARDGRIITTLPKAKELRSFVERVITLSRRAQNPEEGADAAEQVARRPPPPSGRRILPRRQPPAGRIDRQARRVVAGVGYPVMVKASAGGGGRGMRIVRGESEIAHAVETALNEALAAFKNGDVYVERYIERPRHIETQMLARERNNYPHASTHARVRRGQERSPRRP